MAARLCPPGRKGEGERREFIINFKGLEAILSGKGGEREGEGEVRVRPMLGLDRRTSSSRATLELDHRRDRGCRR